MYWSGVPYYANQSLIVSVNVRSRATELLLTPPESVVFGLNSSIIVQYRDLDNNTQGITNSSSWGSHVNITVWRDDGAVSGEYDSSDSFFGPAAKACWVREIGNGQYEILINTTVINDIGTFIFWIWGNWTGAPYYDAAKTEVSITIKSRNTELSYISPGTIGFGLNASIEVTYWDVENQTKIDNSSGKMHFYIYRDDGNGQFDGGDVFFGPLDGYAWVYNISIDTFIIDINTSQLLQLGDYNFWIWANWTGSPFYDNTSVLITVRTRARITELLYDTPPTTPYGDLVNITVHYKDLDFSEGIGNQTLNIFFTINNLNLYTIYNLDQNGNYSLEVNTTDPMLGLGDFNLTVNAICYGAPFYSNKSVSVALSIRKIATDLKIIDFDRIIPWNDLLNVTLTFNDTDHNSIGISLTEDNVNCTWTNYNFRDLGSGGFIIEINTSVDIEGDYTAWIFVNKSIYYDTKNISFTFTVRKRYTDYYSNASFVSNWPWGYNFTAEIHYIDTEHGSSLIAGNLDIVADAPWDKGGNYSIKFDSISRKFYVEFNTSYTEENIIYVIEVTLHKEHYVNQTFEIRVTIKYPPSILFVKEITPGTSIAWGDNFTITVTFNDTEDYHPITNGIISLIPSSTWPPENYSVIETLPGVYLITINTTWQNRPEGTYKVTINAEAENYHNASTAIMVTIRNISTSLSIQSFPPYVNFGSNASIVVFYNDTEAGHGGIGLEAANIQVYWKDNSGQFHAWDGIDVNGSYYVYENATPGVYTIYLNSSTDLGLGDFQIYVNASLKESYWGIWSYHYAYGETLFVLRITEIDTALTAVSVPAGDIPYNDNFTITINYNDTINNVGIDGAIILVDGWGNYWTVYSGSAGVYSIVINSSYVSFNQLNMLLEVRIFANKTYYMSRNLSVYVNIREILTSFSYTPPKITPFNNTVAVNLVYLNVDHGSPITNNSGAVELMCNVTGWGAEYSVEDIGNGNYNLTIDTSQLPTTGNYPLNISIFWKGVPYYSNQSLIIIIKVRNITTSISVNPIDAVPWRENVTFTFRYFINDYESIHNTNPLNNALTLIPNNYSPYTIVPQGNGSYLVTIDYSALSNVKTYSLWIFASYPNCNSVNQSFSFVVRPRLTDLVYEPPEVTPYEFLANISMTYLDLDNSSRGITNTTGFVQINVYYNMAQWGMENYSTSDLGNGNYIVQIDTNKLPKFGSFLFKIEVNWTYGSYYENCSIDVTVNIRPRNTEFSYTPPEITYYGALVNITLYYTDLDKNVGISNRSFYGAKLNFYGLVDNNLTYTQYTVTEEAYGVFTLKINSSRILLNKIGYHTVQVNVTWIDKPYFQNQSLTIQFKLREIYTDYSVMIGNESTIVYSGWPWGVDVPIQITYTDTDQNTPVRNSNISVVGELAYADPANYSIINDGSGTFLLTLLGDKPENLISYHFYITLYKSEIYIRQNITLIISFRKSITTLMVHTELSNTSVPWGDNITIFFSYNNTEETGYPGIPSAQISYNITVNENPVPEAENNCSWKEVSVYGPGMYMLTMNTTWATNLPIVCYFTITAEVPNAILAQTIYSVEIRSIETELYALSWNSSVWIESAESFNVTVKFYDLDHKQGIENNSHPLNYSTNQYANVQFYFYKNGIYYPRGTWEYGTIIILNSTQLGAEEGVYNLIFKWNASLVEELGYVVQIYVNGTYLQEAETTIVTDLQFRIHNTSLTIDMEYAKNESSNPNFPNITQQYTGFCYYGQKINITFFYYDTQAGYYGNGTSGAMVYLNWSMVYYRIYYMDEIKGSNWSGVYNIQIDTYQFTNMTRTWYIKFQFRKTTANLIYNESQLILPLTILPAPTQLTNYSLIQPTPWGDIIKLYLNYSNGLTGEGIPSPDWTTSGIAQWNISEYYVEYLGNGRYLFNMFSNVKEVGTYIATVTFRKLNYAPIEKNFTIIIRPIYTQIILSENKNTSIFRHLSSDIFQVFYQVNDIESSSHLAYISNANITTNWTGTFNYVYQLNKYILNFSGDINVGQYFVKVTFESVHFQTQEIIFNITITQAKTQITVHIPRNTYQYINFEIKIKFEVVLEGYTIPINETYYLRCYIYKDGNLIKNISPEFLGAGEFSFTITTSDLEPGSYRLIIIGVPLDTNYASFEVEQFFTVLSIFQYPWMIVAMVGMAAVAGFYGYRKIKWILTPYQVKEIIKAIKLIKKGKEDAKVPVVRNRAEIFRDEFQEYWASIEVKVPKLVSKEISEFAKEMTSILRTRITIPEAEKLITELKGYSIEDADARLSSMKIPPEARQRLLKIAGVIKEYERDIQEFLEYFRTIKGSEATYEQVEEIVRTIRSLSPADADKYLESMVFSKEDRIKFFNILGIPIEDLLKREPGKIKPEKRRKKQERVSKKKKEEISKKEKGISKKEFQERPHKPLSEEDLKTELALISELRESERMELLQDLKKLPYEDQISILSQLKERGPEKEEKLPPKTYEKIEKPLKKEVRPPLTEEELKAELDAIPYLTDTVKANLLKDLKSMDYISQQDVLKGLKLEKNLNNNKKEEGGS